MKTLLVTGTPGTGKTTLAKQLSLLLNYTYFDVNSFIKKAHIYGSYDRRRHCYVVDTAKLASRLVKVSQKALKTGKNGLIIDSHLSHFLPPKHADLCIVTRCSLGTLKRRLAKKGYDMAKIRENLDAEIFEVCLSEARELGHKVVVFDTAQAKNSTVKAFAIKVAKQVRT